MRDGRGKGWEEEPSVVGVTGALFPADGAAGEPAGPRDRAVSEKLA